MPFTTKGRYIRVLKCLYFHCNTECERRCFDGVSADSAKQGGTEASQGVMTVSSRTINSSAEG
jgi:hypothetical protein